MTAFITIGNFSGYVPELFKMSKEDFIRTYKGSINRDASIVYEAIQNHAKELGLNENPAEIIIVAEETPGAEGKGNNEVSVPKRRTKKANN
jgi:hypothetical protein